MAAAVRALAEAGLPAPVCLATHALLADEGLHALREAGATRFVSTDSVPHASNAIALGALLADAVREVS